LALLFLRRDRKNNLEDSGKGKWSELGQVEGSWAVCLPGKEERH
jgi:hypothetical protein